MQKVQQKKYDLLKGNICMNIENKASRKLAKDINYEKKAKKIVVRIQRGDQK